MREQAVRGSMYSWLLCSQRFGPTAGQGLHGADKGAWEAQVTHRALAFADQVGSKGSCGARTGLGRLQPFRGCVGFSSGWPACAVCAFQCF
jgi:hypothetical protein